ncbi:hypothetical protein E2C01_087622 [Portunus trituberculatus]|uniref:Uncharacterized protein n=1 Tax=Portunus trituberculatus TaxID=210409 RepID=A0A5B7JC72_PORTR|nr:hypothetical protein [Portunus trituberculatus]
MWRPRPNTITRPHTAAPPMGEARLRRTRCFNTFTRRGREEEEKEQEEEEEATQVLLSRGSCEVTRGMVFSAFRFSLHRHVSQGSVSILDSSILTDESHRKG